MEKTWIIVNEKASRVLKNKEQVQQLAENNFDKKNVVFVDDPKNLKGAVRNALSHEPECIVFGGGDGTIISSIEVCLEENYQGDYGLLPLGTSNYLARNLHVPLDLPAAFEFLRQQDSVPVYFGRANGKLFSLMAATGLTASVSESVEVKLKQRIGQGAYIVELFRQLPKRDSFTFELSYSGNKKRTIKGQSHQIVFVNASLDSQASVIPDSSLKHKKLRIVAFTSGVNIWKVMISALLYMVTMGRVKKGMITATVDSAELTTSPAQDVSLDGEIATSTPLAVEMLEKPVHIIGTY